MLAEDDASVRRFLEVILRRAGYDVASAEEGASALQTALSEKFDACVFDAIMPNLSGYELCRIFKQHPDLKDIPLVILSGRESEECAEADAYLIKTAHLQDELLLALSRLLEKKG